MRLLCQESRAIIAYEDTIIEQSALNKTATNNTKLLNSTKFKKVDFKRSITTGNTVLYCQR